MTPLLLSKPKAARYLGVSRWKLDRLLICGAISERDGMVITASIDAYVAGVRPTEPRPLPNLKATLAGCR